MSTHEVQSTTDATTELLRDIKAELTQLNRHFSDFLAAEVRSAASSGELADKMGFAPPPAPCPKCNAEMKLRHGSRGSFWGCSKYSEGCRGTRNCECPLTGTAKAQDSPAIAATVQHPVMPMSTLDRCRP